MDYGHALTFGTFITPVNTQPQTPVALAQLSEQLGYDLVTFQDHPYQPGFLDTWTLLSYAAAATTSIQLAPNVLNLPLRPPAVMARAAASLDLLSGGRFAFGIGAGAFWDAIEAMGGRRLTPGEGVDALAEAIDLIRAIWNPSERTPLRGGEYYPTAGAKRGPRPAHEIPIWVGAYKPRMLRLTGTQADGWLPSLRYLNQGAIPDLQARIDDAATDAGRDPGEVRRLLNISGTESADQLAALAIEQGFATFIVGSDQPNLLSAFAHETMPAVREIVDSERNGGRVTSQRRTARALALRREGIRYEDLPPELAEIAIEPGDFAYQDVRSTYMRGGRPGLVLQPRTTVEVAAALAFAQQHPGVAFGLRSGGHGISGRSTNDGGIILDLGAMRAIEVLDETSRRVRIEPGARWQDVAAVLEPYGWAISSGDYGGVGVGGLATAGGIGLLGREHGLTIDHLVAVEVMLADGSQLRTSADEHTDVFWAMRGAGANIGVATAFEFEAQPVGELAWVQLAFDASDTARMLERFGAAMEAAPRDVTMFLIVGAGHPSEPPVAQLYGIVDSNDRDTIIQRLTPFLELGTLLQQSVQLTSYARVMANASGAPHDGQGEPRVRSGLVGHLDTQTATAAASLIRSGHTPWFQVRAVGGAIADVPADATAYAHRDANFSISAIGRSAAFDELWQALAERFDGLYVSFESRQDAAVLAQAFPPATLERLREVKQRVDPTGFFRDNFPVSPPL